MKKAHKILPWIILFVPFIVLSLFYNSIDNRVLIYRNFSGGEILFAPKLLFTVFRVPLIEVVCGLMIETARIKTSVFSLEDKSNYCQFWAILLYTVALKSLFQTIEFFCFGVFQSAYYANIFFLLTIFVVAVGVILILFKIKQIMAIFKNADLKFSCWKKFVLASLLFIYIALAFTPLFIYK